MVVMKRNRKIFVPSVGVPVVESARRYKCGQVGYKGRGVHNYVDGYCSMSVKMRRK